MMRSRVVFKLKVNFEVPTILMTYIFDSKQHEEVRAQYFTIQESILLIPIVPNAVSADIL